MFEKGSYVIKAMNKVCKVEDIVKVDENKDKLYYLLIPIEEQSGKIFVPIDRADLCMRSVMSIEQVEKLIADVPRIKEMIVDDEKMLELRYKEVMKSEEPELLVGMIKLIYLRSKKRTEEGKKNTVMDQKYYRLAEDCLYSEIAFVLGKDKGEIREMIEKSCEKNTDI